MNSTKWWLALVVVFAIADGAQASEWPWDGCRLWETTVSQLVNEAARQHIVKKEKESTSISLATRQNGFPVAAAPQ